MSAVQPVHLLHLPDEILLKICMEFLPLSSIKAVKETCKQLYHICQFKEILNKQMFVLRLYFNEDMELLDRFINLNKDFLNLDLDIGYDPIMPIPICHFPYLQGIEFIIDQIIRLGSKINSLTLRSSHYDKASKVSFQAVERILLSCANLIELRFHKIAFQWCGSSGIKPEDTNAKLEVLSFYKCNFNCDHEMDIFLNFYPNIKTFELIRDSENMTGVSDEFIINKITTYNKCIQTLKVDPKNRRGFSKAEFIKLATSDLTLHSIRLYGGEVKEFITLFSKYNHLNEVEICRCESFDAECWRYLLSHCPKIESISLNDLSSLNISEILNIISEFGINLRMLKLTSIPGHCDDTADLKFHNLRSLQMRNCNTCPWKRHKILKFLENFHLKQLIVDESGSSVLHKIISSKDTLVTLKLKNSKGYLDWKIQFSKLEVLEIHGFQLYVNNIILLLDCPCLKKLILKGNLVSNRLRKDSSSKVWLRQEQCKRIVTKFPLLEHLDLCTETNLVYDCVLELCNGLKFLKFLRYAPPGSLNLHYLRSQEIAEMKRYKVCKHWVSMNASFNPYYVVRDLLTKEGTCY